MTTCLPGQSATGEADSTGSPDSGHHRRQLGAISERRLFFMVGGLSLFGPLCVDMYIPSLPTLSRDLHASASSIQFSLTTCLIGLALGQVLIGPASDRLGRRRPLLGGLALFIAASLLCALAPSAPVLAAFRAGQGLGGAAGIVISRAIVRDLFSGTAAARFFSMLILVTGTGPILAPQIGAELLRITSWRGEFVFLALAGSLLFFMAATRLPETLQASNRDASGLRSTLRSMRVVGTSRVFLANSLACGLGFGAIFAYIAGSSFVFENIFHLSPQMFGLLFALNGCGLVATGQLSARIVGRFGPERLLTAGLVIMAMSGVSLLLVVVGGVGLPGVIPCLFCAICCNGLVSPSAMALALNNFPEAAGSASALLGVLQFAIGAIVAPMIGLAGDDTAMPMAIAMAFFGVAAITTRMAMLRSLRLATTPAAATSET